MIKFQPVAAAGVVLIGLLVLAILSAIHSRSAFAQEPAQSTGTLSGRAYRLVEQTIVDGAIVDETEVPVIDGSIAIPELGIDQPLSPGGSFRFTEIPVSADWRNPTLVTVIFTAPALGSYTYLNVRLYPGTGGPILTPQMIETPRVNDLSRGGGGRSDAGTQLPGAGQGASTVSPRIPVIAALLAIVGTVLLAVSTTLHRMSRFT